MKPHPRIRKTIKWGGAAVTVLLVVVWIGSGRGWLARLSNSRNWYVGMSEGLLAYQYNPSFLHTYVRVPGWHGEWVQRPLKWRPQLEMSGNYVSLEIPAWMCVATSTAITLFAWRIDTLARRRARLNLCPKCGYDRTGLLKDAKCPECGAVPAGV